MFHCLQRWHTLCNKKKKNDWENKIIRSDKYTLFSDKDRPPPPSLPSKKQKYDSDDSSDGHRYKKRRSSKYNRHSSSVRKSRRVIYDVDSESTGSVTAPDSTSESDLASERRHRKIAKKKQSKNKMRERRELKTSRSSRKTSNVPHGIILPKLSSGRRG